MPSGAGKATCRSDSGLVAAGPDRYIDREIDAIEQAIADGPKSREELAQAVNARTWGPGRFRRALRLALSERRVTRVGRNSYARA
jgi:hypothetical protein